MFDRLPWFTEKARGFCDRLGMPMPKVVVTETRIFGYRPPVIVLTVEIGGLAGSRKLPEPELRVTGEALGDMPDEELQLSLARALLAHREISSGRSRLWQNMQVAAAVAMGLGTFAGIVLLRWSWAVVLPVLVLYIAGLLCAAFLVSFRSMRNQALETVELTGDPKTALKAMRRSEPDPPWLPKFLGNWFRRRQGRDVDYIAVRLAERYPSVDLSDEASAVSEPPA